MHLVDGANVGPGNTFVGGDPLAGTSPTQVTPAIANAWQFELANLVQFAGLTLNKADNTQVWQAIATLAARRSLLKNALINGSFRINARPSGGGPFTGAAKYVQDRWILFPGSGSGSATWSPDGDALPAEEAVTFSPAVSIWTQGVAATTNGPYLEQRIERATTFQGQTVTVSFWLKCTAVGSGTTVTFTPSLIQYFGATGSTAVTIAGSNIVVTNGAALAQFQATFQVPSCAGKTWNIGQDYLALRLTGPTGKTFTVSFYAAQLELGAKASDFEIRPHGYELLLCRRYFENSLAIDSQGQIGAPSASTHRAYSPAGTTAFGFNERFAVPKRIAPAMIFSDPGGVAGQIRWNGTTLTVSSVVGGGTACTGSPVVATSQAAGMVEAGWSADAEL